MIAVRTLFAAVMAVMVAGTVAQSSSSSTGVARSSSSTGAAASSSALPSLSSSSAAPVIPGVNDSSSSVWIVSSSSSTGADAPFYYPAGTYEIAYAIELYDSTIPAALSGALAKDFAATVGEAYNITTDIILPYVLVNVKLPESSTFHIMQTGPVNATANAVVLGNVTNVIAPVIALDLARAFATAAANGSIVMTESSSYISNFYPQVITPVESAQPGNNDNTNGASAVSASLLIGSMVAALALAF